MTPVLPKPRLYVPFADGRYTVTARLRPLGAEPSFQVDARYLEYAAGKHRNHRDARTQYHAERGLRPELARAIAAFALRTLPAEHPEAFAVALDDTRAILENRLLGLTLELDLAEGRVVGQRRGPAALAGGEKVFDGTDFTRLPLLEALALQIQEDWAVVARDPATRGDVTAAIHVSFPSHWRPEDKIGRSFVEVHAPIPGIDPLLKAAPSLVDAMIGKGPWERFTWTLPRYPHLDEHVDVVAARGKPPVPKAADAARAAWLRVERQVIQGFPEADGALFMIRLHVLPLHEVLAAEPTAAAALASAIRSKTAPQRAYKALDDWHEPLLAHLDGLASGRPVS
jgi:hypothetical protein